jgi:hypothetical protein
LLGKASHSTATAKIRTRQPASDSCGSSMGSASSTKASGG